MDNKNLHIDQLKKESKDFFANGEIAWKKTEEEVFAELEKKIAKKPAGKSVSIYPTILKWSAAAVIFLLVGFGSLVLFYSKTIETLPGQSLVAELPDGSTVELNAGSTLKYYPLKWRFDRKLIFEGEAYFEVEKGEKFEVESKNGITQVVGTSFNIYSRASNYRVTCFTGKVNVVSNANESVILTPNEHVEIVNGEFVMNSDYKANKAIDWKMGMFDFSGRPLMEVFGEIERQFGVRIQLQSGLSSRNFSGNFAKSENVEDALNNICIPMQLKYIKQSEGVFLVVDKNS